MAGVGALVVTLGSARSAGAWCAGVQQSQCPANSLCLYFGDNFGGPVQSLVGSNPDINLPSCGTCDCPCFDGAARSILNNDTNSWVVYDKANYSGTQFNSQGFPTDCVCLDPGHSATGSALGPVYLNDFSARVKTQDCSSSFCTTKP
jgi:hypothetical protein